MWGQDHIRVNARAIRHLKMSDTSSPSLSPLAVLSQFIFYVSHGQARPARGLELNSVKELSWPKDAKKPFGFYSRRSL